jgi:hypothetical protein
MLTTPHIEEVAVSHIAHAVPGNAAMPRLRHELRQQYFNASPAVFDMLGFARDTGRPESRLG